MPIHERPTVLMADDDEDDCMLARHAFEQSLAQGDFVCVYDGHELMEYLFSSVERNAGEQKALPAFILLDLNMPGKDGREALLEIKSQQALRHIPIIIFTTSKEHRDMDFTLNAGAEAFITKPPLFDEWVEVMKSLHENWLK